MKHIVLLTALWAGGAQADSLCGVRDEATIRATLAGEWEHRGGGAYITASDEQTGPFEGVTRISDTGEVEVADLTFLIAPLLTPALSDVVYDVDQMDDILDTVDAAWIADAVSDTLCGPEALPQLSAIYQISEDLNGQLTIVPYFSDRTVLVLEAEWRGDWGIAFITVAALLTPTE